MSDVWCKALPWLLEDDHVTTADELQELTLHFREHPPNAGDHLCCRYRPLHYASRNQRGEHAVAVVKALLTVDTHAVRMKNEKGHLPLHMAVKHQKGEHSFAVTEAILTAFPLAAQEKSSGEFCHCTLRLITGWASMAWRW